LKTQRLRIHYKLNGEAAELAHRELVAALEGACRTGGAPLAYSQGKRPSPQITLAAPLPLGVTSDCELADLYLEARLQPNEFRERLAAHLPDGMCLLAAEEVGLDSPSLPSLLRWAEYELQCPWGDLSAEDLTVGVRRLLAAHSLPSEYRRESKVRAYDLRPLVLGIWIGNEPAGDAVHHLSMRLRAEPDATGRADQVALALALPQSWRIRRTRLQLEEIQAAVSAYRRGPVSGWE